MATFLLYHHTVFPLYIQMGKQRGRSREGYFSSFYKVINSILLRSNPHDSFNCNYPLKALWNEAGQRLIEFCQENALVIANTLFQQHKRRLYLIIFFAAKDGEALYSQLKQDRELTVAQIMSFLLPNSDLNWRK